MALMKAGIPIGKLDCAELRALFEENGYRLTDSRHLLDLVPFILKQEKDILRLLHVAWCWAMHDLEKR